MNIRPPVCGWAIGDDKFISKRKSDQHGGQDQRRCTPMHKPHQSWISFDHEHFLLDP
jgi:hypothetical protein